MRVLGVSSGPTDAAAAVVEDGQVLAAEAEERLTRVLRDGSFPARAIVDCLEVAAVDPASIDAVVVHQKPSNTLGRILATDRRRGLRGFGAFVADMPRFVRHELTAGQRAADLLRRLGGRRPELVYAEHALSSTAAAFLQSPFRSAAILVVGDAGEWDTAAVAHGANHRIDVLAEQRHPDSLGALCDVVRTWCGLASSADLGPLARLAAAGEPSFAEVFSDLVRVNDDGSVAVDAKAFGWWRSHPGRSRRLQRLFGGPPRQPGAPITSREADLACSLQQVLEVAMVAMAARAHELTGEARLCLGGALAANPTTNAALAAASPFERLWVPPDVGTAGCAVGAALWYWHSELGNRREVHGADGTADGDAGSDRDAAELARDRAVVATGRQVRSEEVVTLLDALGVENRRASGPEDLAGEVARALCDGSEVGWFRGRMELGPLPLGRRCVLRAPGAPDVRTSEVVEPCVAVVAVEDLADCVEATVPAADLRFVPAAVVSAGPLVDPPVVIDVPSGTEAPEPRELIRVLAVDAAVEPELHMVLAELARLGRPRVLIAGPLADPAEPPACTVEDALRVAELRELAMLVIEDVLVPTPVRGRAAIGT